MIVTAIAMLVVMILVFVLGISVILIGTLVLIDFPGNVQEIIQIYIMFSSDNYIE